MFKINCLNNYFTFFIIFILFFFACCFKINDYDIFWHLKIGQFFFDTGKILDSNHFSWTYPSFPWIPSYWLFEVLVYSVFKTFGFSGLIVLNAFIHAITWGSLAGHCSRFAREWFVLLLFVVAIDASVFHFMLRPHVFSFLGISLLIQILSPLCLNPINQKIFWKGALLFFLWANLHSGVVFGLAYLGLFLGIKILVRPSKESLKYCLLFFVCLSATFINPNGGDLFTYVFDHLSMNRVIPLEELQHLSFTMHPKHFVSLGLFLILFLGLIFATKSKISQRLFFLSLLGLSAYLLGKGIRFIPVVFLFCIPNLCFLAEKYSLLKKREEKLKIRIFLILCSILTLWHLHARVFTLSGNYYQTGLGLHEESFPIKACEFLPQKKSIRLYNSFTTGGVILWKFDGNVKVFQDGRIHAYPKDFFQKIEAAKRAPSLWKSLIEDFQIDTVLINKTEDPSHFWMDLKRGGWQILFEDENFFVGVKKA
jgi:hypothetical protein